MSILLLQKAFDVLHLLGSGAAFAFALSWAFRGIAMRQGKEGRRGVAVSVARVILATVLCTALAVCMYFASLLGASSVALGLGAAVLLAARSFFPPRKDGTADFSDRAAFLGLAAVVTLGVLVAGPPLFTSPAAWLYAIIFAALFKAAASLLFGEQIRKAVLAAGDDEVRMRAKKALLYSGTAFAVLATLHFVLFAEGIGMFPGWTFGRGGAYRYGAGDRVVNVPSAPSQQLQVIADVRYAIEGLGATVQVDRDGQTFQYRDAAGAFTTREATVIAGQEAVSISTVQQPCVNTSATFTPLFSSVFRVSGSSATIVCELRITRRPLSAAEKTAPDVAFSAHADLRHRVLLNAAGAMAVGFGNRSGSISVLTAAGPQELMVPDCFAGDSGTVSTATADVTMLCEGSGVVRIEGKTLPSPAPRRVVSAAGVSDISSTSVINSVVLADLCGPYTLRPDDDAARHDCYEAMRYRLLHCAGDDRAQCIRSVAARTLAPELCGLLSTSVPWKRKGVQSDAGAQSCTVAVALLRDDPALCASLTDDTGKWRSECFMGIANQRNDAGLCAEVADEFVSRCESQAKGSPAVLRDVSFWLQPSAERAALLSAAETLANEAAGGEKEE